MGEASFLDGKLVKTSLPVMHEPSGAEAPALKRLLLPQGELAQFYDADEPIRYMAFIELRSGSVRGNHYHKIKEESIYMIQGEVLLLTQMLESGERQALTLRAGDLALIRPGIAHALRIVQPGQAIEFAQVRFDAGDTYRTGFDLTDWHP
jgi:oxalate decarboxylase/phosphoglucose isomerase-like protein (cupin superfamily)